MDFPFTPRLEALLASDRERILIGVLGPPASGKSTLARRLVQKLSHHAVIALPMDGFHLPNEVLLKKGILPWKGCHFTFDAARFVHTVERIQDNAELVKCPSYDRTVHHDAIEDAIEIDMHHRIIIAEGNYLLLDVEPWSSLRDIWDFSIYVDVHPDIQLQRLIARHVKGGRTAVEARAKAGSTDLPNSKLIQNVRHLADFVFEPPANFL
ncbi:MAG: AAA family ATPase [Saprospiraceae bacterium]|nr:AAA family ATPase [Saprospiraceae bacterium]